MFLTIQFPLLDYRLLQSNPNRTERPNWPTPKETEIARYFGRVFGKGDINYYGPWDDEKRYCRAKGVINLCGRGENSYYHSLHESDCRSRIQFRRFQSDGRFFAKYDIGFTDQFEETLKGSLTPDELRQSVYNHIEKYLLCPVRVKVGSKLMPFTPLIDTGKHLRNAFFWSTFSGKRSFDAKELRYQVEDGEPQIIALLDAEMIDLKCFAEKKIEMPALSGAGIQLFFDHIQYQQGRDNYRAKVWIIASGNERHNNPATPQDFSKYNSTMKSLRKNLLRVHQEKIILNKLFELISTDKFITSSEEIKERLCRYLHKKILNLSNAYRNSQNQNPLVEIAFKLDDTSNGAENFNDQVEGLAYFLKWLEKQETVDDKKAIKEYLNRNKKSIDDFLKDITVFISYNHANGAIANQLAQKFVEEKIKVILDSQAMLAGTKIDDFITNSIKMSDATVSIVSRESLQSGWVGVETVNTFYYKKFFPDKKFIPCNIDTDFFGDDFLIDTVKKIDERINTIDEKIQEQTRLRVDSQNFNAERRRLFYLRDHLDAIIEELKAGLCTDITPPNFDNNVPKIIRAIRQ
jgi:TIR domain